MAPINVDNKKRMAVLSQISRERSRRRSLQQSFIILFLRTRTILRALLLSISFLLYDKVVTVDSSYSHSATVILRILSQFCYFPNLTLVKLINTNSVYSHSGLCHTLLIITTFSLPKQENTLFTDTFEAKIAETSQ